MRCICCDQPLTSFDNEKYCKICISASEDESTKFKDPQHVLLTDRAFRERYKPKRPD